LSNYSAAYGAFIGASANSSKQFKFVDFLPYSNVWEYFTMAPINVNPDTAMDVLATFEDAPLGAYAAVEQILGQLTIVASLA
jgi:hypothetical protein